MKKNFSQMLEEMGFAQPAGRDRFYNSPMPTRSSQVDVDPDIDKPDTGLSAEPDIEDPTEFQLGDNQIVIMSTSALKKLLSAAESGQELAFDDLPDEDDLFGSDEQMSSRGPDGFGSMSSEEDGKLSSEEDGVNPDDEFGNQDADRFNLDGEPNDLQTSQEDRDRQGNIRQVRGARLSYKRQQPDGTFSEMWVYNVGEGMNDTLAIKRAILSGTDIPDNHFTSEDGKQRYKIVTLGNAQILKIEGLPN